MNRVVVAECAIRKSFPLGTISLGLDRIMVILVFG